MRFVKDGIFLIDTEKELTGLMFNYERPQDEWYDWLNKMTEPRKCVLDIEDGTGDTLTSFILQINSDGTVEVENIIGDGSLADIDGDIIYDTEHQRVRIQIEGV